MFGYVYILQMKNGKYYIGSTTCLERRFREHQRGNVDSTRNNRPLVLIFSKLFDTIQEAHKNELQLKKWKSRKMINQFISAG